MYKHILYTQLNATTYATDGVLDEIRKTRGYSYEDQVRTNDWNSNYTIHLMLLFTFWLDHGDNMFRGLFARLSQQVEIILHRTSAYRWRDPFRCRWFRLLWCAQVSNTKRTAIPSRHLHEMFTVAKMTTGFASKWWLVIWSLFRVVYIIVSRWTARTSLWPSDISSVNRSGCRTIGQPTKWTRVKGI